MRLSQSIIRAAQINGEGNATLCGGRRSTWREFRVEVATFASVLRGQGMKIGDRVGILALNSDFYQQAFFAIPWGGGVMVPLNTRWAAGEIIFAGNNAEISLLLVDRHFADIALQIAEQVPTIKSVIHMGEGDSCETVLNLADLYSDAEPIEDAGRGYNDLAGIFYTGGTTGFPKGVMLSHQNLVANAICNCASLEVNKSGITYLHAAPMFHLADIAVSLAHTINGNTHAFIERFSPAALVDAIETFRVTDVLLVPTMISMMVNDPLLQHSDISSLKKIVYGASPMTTGTLRSALAALPSVVFIQAYGQTELSPVVTVLKPEYHCLNGEKAKKISSAGQCNIGCEIKIVDDVGNTLPSGVVGEVAATGPNVMMGYWKNPEQSEKTVRYGWVLTGDAGYLDEDGFLFLVDRKKDMIVSGGENVFSAEVENAISTHAAVHEVVVIGTPSEKWGEAVHAIVRLKPGKTASQYDIIQHCRSQIAGYKCPQEVEFREEPFPVTGAGKIRKNDIRAPYWAGMEKNVN